jgi:steroid delta-isomerase-like uncharacterized protein
MAAERSARFATRFADAWAAQDSKSATALFRSDARVLLQGNGDERMGSEAIQRTFAEGFRTYKSGRLTIGRIWAAADTSVIEVLFSAVFRADVVGAAGRPEPLWLPGMTAGDKSTGVVGAYLVTFDEGGLVRTATQYMDAMTLMGQIGPPLLPPGIDVRPFPMTVPAGTGILESKGTPEETKNMAVQDALLAATDRHDADGALALLADGAVYDDFRTPWAVNKEGLRGDLLAIFSAFPDWRVVAKPLQFAAGDYVVTEHVDAGTFRGTFLGHEPNGQAFTSHGLLVAQYKDGKVLRGYAYGDASEMLGQLGIVEVYPPDAGAPR